MPSCEACFDAEAYKTCGIQPSPHLGQSEFFKPTAALPAPSKWGRPSVAGSPSSAAATRPSIWSSHGPIRQASSPSARAPSSSPNKLSRLQLERNQSPIAPSLDELGDKLRRVGLQNSPAPSTAAPHTPSTATPRPALSRRPLPELPRDSSRPNGPLRSGSPAKAAPAATQPSTSPVKTAPMTTRPSTSPVKPSAERLLGSIASPDSCAICAQPLDNADFVELSSSQVRMHSSCFRCGGCGKELGGGRFVEAEARWWHREVGCIPNSRAALTDPRLTSLCFVQCAPAPQTYRTIIPKLQETIDDSDQAGQTPAYTPAQTPFEEKSPTCFACGQQLGIGRSITVPRSGRSFHERCFCCAGCSKPFVSEKGFVEQDGLPYHQQVRRLPQLAYRLPADSQTLYSALGQRSRPVRLALQRLLRSLPLRFRPLARLATSQVRRPCRRSTASRLRRRPNLQSSRPSSRAGRVLQQVWAGS